MDRSSYQRLHGTSAPGLPPRDSPFRHEVVTCRVGDGGASLGERAGATRVFRGAWVAGEPGRRREVHGDEKAPERVRGGGCVVAGGGGCPHGPPTKIRGGAPHVAIPQPREDV